VHAITVAASATGPLLLALGHDTTDSYRPLLLALTTLPLAVHCVTGRDAGESVGDLGNPHRAAVAEEYRGNGCGPMPPPQTERSEG
jgi:hypothetical protein